MSILRNAYVAVSNLGVDGHRYDREGGGRYDGDGVAHTHVYIIADPRLRPQAVGIILIGAVDYPALRWQMGVCL